MYMCVNVGENENPTHHLPPWKKFLYKSLLVLDVNFSLSLSVSLQDILVRVCFILGNLTTEDQETRRELFSTHHALPPLTSLTASCVAAEMAQVRLLTGHPAMESSLSLYMYSTLGMEFSSLFIVLYSTPLYA